MCGIVFSLHWASDHPRGWPEEKGWNELCEANGARGPDSRTEHTVELDIGGVLLVLRFFASVLHLRGERVTVQPLVDEAGDVFCWNGEVFEGLNVGENENDGELLLRALSDPTLEDPRSVFASIEGPYAFVYLKRSAHRLYFSRDPLGRRSLLRHLDPSGALLLASVAIDKALSPEEVFPQDIHYVDLDKFATGTLADALAALPREVPGARPAFLRPEDVNPHLPVEAEVGLGVELISKTVDAFIDSLEASVRLRVQHIPRMAKQSDTDSRVAILFSGGVDCTLIALLAHRCLPIEEGIDLLNVAFENPRKLGLAERKNSHKKKEQDRDGPEGNTDKYAVPDRITGLDAVAELRDVCPGRRWNFVCVDVPYEECLPQQPHVEELMYPSDTIMDLSLANALYFASRGKGICTSSIAAPSREYTSPARVLLSGLGADEQLGGYSRHRRAFEREGWKGLVEELQLDITRLPSRNLGRDDRVISSWGKETRYPYLSLSFIEFVSQLPVHLKVNPALPEGTGDKILLRMAARKVGLLRASERRKRAMQFGSRSARMGEHDRKGNLKLDAL